MALKYSFILEAVNKASAPIKAVAASVATVGRAAKVADGQMKGAAGGTAQLTRNLKSVGRAGDSAQNGVGKAMRVVRLLRVAIRRPATFIVRTKMDEGRIISMAQSFGTKAGRLFGMAVNGGMAAVAAFAIVGLGIAEFIGQIISAGKEFDKGFTAKFASQTTKLSGQWDSFLLRVGNAGAFDFITGKMAQLSGWVDRMAANGQLDKWAKSISDTLTGLGESVAGIDWAKLAGDVVDIATAIGDFGKAIADIGGGGLSGLFNVVVVAIIAKMAFALYGLGTALGFVSVAGAPIWAIVLAIAALAAGAFLVYRNWDKISAWFSALWEGFKSNVAAGVNAIVAFFKDMWERAKKIFSEGVSALWNMLPGWMRKILNGGTFSFRVLGNLFGGQSVSNAVGNAARDSGIAPAAPRLFGASPTLAPAAPPMRSPKLAQTQVGGKLEVELTAPKGIRPMVTRMASNNPNVPISYKAKRGPAMADT